MNFPGDCKLTLSDAALCQAIEGTLNAARRDGEDYVRVTGISRVGYGYGDYVLSVTTDTPTGSVVEIRAEAA